MLAGKVFNRLQSLPDRGLFLFDLYILYKPRADCLKVICYFADPDLFPNSLI